MPANMFGGPAWLKTASAVALVAALAIRWTAVFTLGSFSANVAIVPKTAALIYRIQVEETVLREAFAEEYAQYSRVTKRLVPGVY